MALKPTLVQASELKINLLLYGLQGVGKTSLAATAQDHPEMAPALFLNLEGGLLSVAGRGDIQAVEIRKIADLEEVYNAIANREEDFKDFKTVIIDSGTEMYSLAVREAVQHSMERDRRKGKNTSRLEDDIYLEDYGTATAQMKRIFRGFRDLNLHTIITALPKNEYHEGTDTIRETRPDIGSSLAQSVMGFQDFVWFMYIGNDGERMLLTEAYGVVRAKTRGPRFAQTIGQMVESPSLPDLFEVLQETEGGKAS